MENSNSRLKLLVSFLVILAIAYGLYYFWPKNKQPKIGNDIKVVKDESIPFMTAFSKGLIPEKDVIKVLQSFRTEKVGNKNQYTYKYLTNLKLQETFYHFEKFSRTDGFKQISVDSSLKDGHYSISFVKDELLAVVTATKVSSGEGSIIDITVMR